MNRPLEPPTQWKRRCCQHRMHPATTTRSELSRRQSRGQGQTTGRGKAIPVLFFSQVGDRHQPQKPNEVYTCTEFFLGVQRGLSEMSDAATQAHRGLRSQVSDHGSKSQFAGTEKRAGERHLPSRSDSTRKGTPHIDKRPDQAGIRMRTRGPSQLHPTRGTNLNPATTHPYVELVRGVTPRSGRPTIATSPPHNTRHNVHLATPATPGGTSPSPPFNLRHPPRHPTPTMT